MAGHIVLADSSVAGQIDRDHSLAASHVTLKAVIFAYLGIDFKAPIEYFLVFGAIKDQLGKK